MLVAHCQIAKIPVLGDNYPTFACGPGQDQHIIVASADLPRPNHIMAGPAQGQDKSSWKALVDEEKHTLLRSGDKTFISDEVGGKFLRGENVFAS